MNEADGSSIAYCGLHCGDCPNHSGQIADLARDLRKKLREHHFERLAPGLARFSKPFANYALCYETIGAMVKLRCKRGCRDNGGPPQCKIRNCCGEHDFQGYWKCTDFESCEKLSFLTATHGDAHTKNLRTINKREVDSSLKGKGYW